MTIDIDARARERYTAEWQKHAKEDVTVEFIGGGKYAFGSELACLRLFHAYRGMGRVGYSKNMNTWFYCQD